MDGLEAATRAVFGQRIQAHHPLHGGDLSQVAQVTLSNGQVVVAKAGPLVRDEENMLTAIRAAGAPAPQPLGRHGDILFLEALPETGAGSENWAQLGEALRRLHSKTGEHYGWSVDYAFGRVDIPNGHAEDWPDFWVGNRILPHLSYVPGGLRPRLLTLCEQLPRLLPKTPDPALLHGDLWTGNVLFGPDGAAHFIDPACYYGDPEVDLAMLHLFGAPHPAFSEAYGPLQDGWETRRAVYSLWPALVHLRLFGTSYRAMVERLLTRLGV